MRLRPLRVTRGRSDTTPKRQFFGAYEETKQEGAVKSHTSFTPEGDGWIYIYIYIYIYMYICKDINMYYHLDHAHEERVANWGQLVYFCLDNGFCFAIGRAITTAWSKAATSPPEASNSSCIEATSPQRRLVTARANIPLTCSMNSGAHPASPRLGLSVLLATDRTRRASAHGLIFPPSFSS